QLLPAGDFMYGNAYCVISSSSTNYYYGINWGPYAMSINGGNKQPFSGQIQINSPMTIKVYYAFTDGYFVL
ncbi:MAG: hypothetical protein OWQ55_06850, partial [Sulfuracidifex metallicus]|nr:hypothetical protein [Sulfuracidifex metallicus]